MRLLHLGNMVNPGSRGIAPAYIPTNPPFYLTGTTKGIRKNASRACYACQEKKTKCEGGIPCEKCRERGSDCVVNRESDERRRVTMKRKLDSLEQDRDLLIRLVETLRQNDRTKGSDVLNLIRSDASLDEIRLCVAESMKQDKCPSDLDRVQAELQRQGGGGSNSRRKIMDIRRLTDDPPYRVPAQPWTTVTDDDDFVSHLVSLFFCWNHSTLDWIDRDLFLRDMRSRDLGSLFCSPLLVNSILAVACYYSDYPEVYATPGDPASRGVHFYDEARRLKDKEEGKLSLTSFQSLGQIYISICVMGKDRLGWKVMVDIADTARELTSKRNKIIADAGEQGEEMARVIDRAVYGLFNLHLIAVITYQKPATMKKPKLGRLTKVHDPEDTWLPYPVHSNPLAAHSACVMNSLVDMGKINHDISMFFFGEDDKPPYSEIVANVNSFSERLEKWAQQLPECIDFDHADTPGVMDMHMRYHSTILTIFGFIKDQPNPDESSREMMSRARAVRMSAVRQTATMLIKFRTQWPVSCMSPCFMQWATISLFTLLPELGNSEPNELFVEICICLRAMARLWLLAKGMLRLLQVTAQQLEVNLPPETRSLFIDFETEAWKAEDRERFNSHYPNFAITVHGKDLSVDDAELDTFLEKWDRFTLAGASDESSPGEGGVHRDSEDV